MSLFGPPNIEKMVMKRDVPGLIKAMSYRKDSGVRKKAASALGKLNDTRAVEPLIAALEDNDIGVREATVETLGKIKDARAVEPLIATLKDNDAGVSYGAAEALGKIGIPAEEPLIAALKDVAVCWRAAMALGEIGDARAVEPLIAALKDGKDKYGSIEWQVAAALGKIGDVRAVEPLIVALRDNDPNNITEVAKALEKIGWQPGEDQAGAAYWIGKRNWEECIKIGAPAVEPLIAVLGGEYWREDIIEALGKIGDARAVPPLVAALTDDKLSVRKTASKALKDLYQRDNLSAKARKTILAQRNIITKQHSDGYHDSCAGGGHYDNGIGVDFPL